MRGRYAPVTGEQHSASENENSSVVEKKESSSVGIPYQKDPYSCVSLWIKIFFRYKIVTGIFSGKFSVELLWLDY